MRNVLGRRGQRILLLLSAVMLWTGCDDTTRTAVEDGIIDASTSLVGALIEAIVALAAEAATATISLV